MNGNQWIVIGTSLAALAVILGAFGAHGLESWVHENIADREEQTKRLENWDTASRYMIYHALGLTLLGLAAPRIQPKFAFTSAAMFLVGVLLFSGCLYAWVLTGNKTLVMIVPVGGIGFILGWAFFALAAFRFGIDGSRKSEAGSQ